MNPVAKLLMGLGLFLIFAGLLWQFGLLSWFGRLPGDIRVERENVRFYFPLTSGIVLSLVLSLLMEAIRRLKGR